MILPSITGLLFYQYNRYTIKTYISSKIFKILNCDNVLKEGDYLFIMSLWKTIFINRTIMFKNATFLVKIWFFIDVFYTLFTYMHLHVPYHFFLTLLYSFMFVKDTLWRYQKMQKYPSNNIVYRTFVLTYPQTFILLLFFCSFTLHCFILHFKYNTIN